VTGLIKNFILISVTLWVIVYTASYGLYEYRSGSKKAAAGVAFLCLAICLLLIKI